MEKNELKPEMKRQQHLVVGLTGSIATGKTTVAEMFREMGARLIDFDLLSRKVVEPESPAWRDIVSFFGDQVLQVDRRLNRKKLSAIVFGDEAKRKKLELFTHPRIQDLYLSELNNIVNEDSKAIILVAIPLLFEVNMASQYELIIVVSTNPETQLRRLVTRDRISEEVAGKIIGTQMPVVEKAKKANFVIMNDISLESTRTQVIEVWNSLKKIREEIIEIV